MARYRIGSEYLGNRYSDNNVDIGNNIKVKYF